MKVEVTRRIKVGAQTLPVKRVEGFMDGITEDVVVEATAVQLRVMAEETRELIIDRLMAATPQAPASSVLERPAVLRRRDIGIEDREPFDHEPLNQRYVDKKAAKGLDGRKLLATGDYIEGITTNRVEGGAGVAYTVGVEDRNHRPSGLPLNTLARIHEFGSGSAGIPARPHWRPVGRQVRASLRKQGANVMADVLRRAIRGVL